MEMKKLIPITPNLNPIDAMDHTFKEAYEGGITSVCVTPGSANLWEKLNVCL